MFRNRIHHNITVTRVMSIARGSQVNEARFVIDRDDKLHTADGYNFMHSDISDTRKICGYMYYDKDKDSYTFMTYNRPSHPILDKFIEHGVTCVHYYKFSNIEG